MKFREELPCNCPPPNAEVIISARSMYRMIKGEMPEERDFHSHRKLNPDGKEYTDSSMECMARGVSLFDNPKQAIEQTAATKPNYRVCHLRLKKGAGKIVKSFGPNHYTWWPLVGFDIMSSCEVQIID